MDVYQRDCPVVARATAVGAGALAVIRCSGAGCFQLLKPLFSRPQVLGNAASHRVFLGRIVDPGSGEWIDEVLLLPFAHGSSYTGEEVVEIHCHGGEAVVERLLQLLCSSGFAPALPGEFSYRAFANGRLDLTQAEAVAALTQAQQQQQRRQALQQLGGGMKSYLQRLHHQLLQLLALLEVQLDYDQDEFEPQAIELSLLVTLKQELQKMLDNYQLSERYRQGQQVVLIGPVNAGKSSFFNLLLRRSRALVAAEAGTTRDYLDAELEFEGRRLHLYDTAGLRLSDDAVEQQGIALSEQLVQQADLLLVVVDGCLGVEPEFESKLAQWPTARWIGLWNKSDRSAAQPPPPGWLPISCTNQEGLPNFFQRLRKALPQPPPIEGVIPLNLRQQRLIQQTSAAVDETLQLAAQQAPFDLLAEPLRHACDLLGELSGSRMRADLLEEIFASFCLGK